MHQILALVHKFFHYKHKLVKLPIAFVNYFDVNKLIIILEPVMNCILPK